MFLKRAFCGSLLIAVLFLSFEMKNSAEYLLIAIMTGIIYKRVQT